MSLNESYKILAIREKYEYEIQRAKDWLDVNQGDINSEPKLEWCIISGLLRCMKRDSGNWENVYLSSPSSFVGTCSICGVSNDIPPPVSAHYCPNCGAKMEEE